MKIGVGVEGPSDRIFWDKVLHKHFRGWQFDVRNLKSKEKLIRDTPDLLESFHDLDYKSGIIITDWDDGPCIGKVREAFSPAIQTEFKRPREDRFLHLAVAVRDLEAWYLADAAAINLLLPDCNFSAPEDTGTLPKGHLKELIRRSQGANAGYNKIDLAKQFGPKFTPGEAMQHSSSFGRYWDIVKATCA